MAVYFWRCLSFLMGYENGDSTYKERQSAKGTIGNEKGQWSRGPILNSYRLFAGGFPDENGQGYKGRPESRGPAISANSMMPCRNQKLRCVIDFNCEGRPLTQR
jgi:hypothetical protein